MGMAHLTLRLRITPAAQSLFYLAVDTNCHAKRPVFRRLAKVYTASMRVTPEIVATNPAYLRQSG